MKCPECNSLNDKTLDSRPLEDHIKTRRRRKCRDCNHTWTTYESSKDQLKIKEQIRLDTVLARFTEEDYQFILKTVKLVIRNKLEEK
jgi:transcriptional repressor NrdR